MISFACPECYTTFEVPDGKIGTKFNCEFCGKRVQVPSAPVESVADRPEPTIPLPADEDYVPNPPAAARGPSLATAPPPSRGLSTVGLFTIVAVTASVLLGAGGVVFLVLASHPAAPRKTADVVAPVTPSVTPPVTPPVPTPVARDEAPAQAQAVLKTNCYRCHGQNGTAEGGFNFILDRDKLVARKKVVPGDAAHSKLYHRIAEGEMPPPDESPRPSSDDVVVLKRWIDDGAVAFGPPTPTAEFLSDDQIVAVMHDDLLGVPERDRKFIRYFTLTHLANAHLSEDELQTYRNTLAKLMNSLSWNKEVVPLHAVGPGATVLRVDIRDYSWNDRLWSDVLSLYPYGVLQKSANAQELFDAAGGRLSYVRADWFIATASRPPLYHELLQLPENERKLEDQLHIDVAGDIQQERVARAGFNGSGISRNNRLIERHESPYGSLWRSYDFADNEGPHNLFAHPLGLGSGANPPQADGGEIIFSLPNGLHAFMLIDGTGRRLDKASLAIVSDPRRPDRAVENGVSCMTCHVRGLVAKSDQVRPHVERNLNAFTKAEADMVRALYPPPAALTSLFAQDNERFRSAAEKTGAPLTTTEPIASVVAQYERELEMTTAAAELGLSPTDLTARLDESASLARTLGPLKVPGGSVQREVFTAAFPDLVRELAKGTYLAPERIKR